MAESSGEGLNRQQRAFAEFYVGEAKLNKSKAYMMAYPSAKKGSAAASANRLLKNDKVLAYVKHLTAEAMRSSVADAAEVLEFFTRMMRGEEEEEEVLLDVTGESFTVRKPPNNNQKLKAAEDLSKYHGLLTDKKEVDLGENARAALTELSIADKKRAIREYIEEHGHE